MSLANRSHLLLVAVLALAFSGLTDQNAYGQGKPTDSGTKPWVVVKGKLGDVNGTGDQVIADFNTEDQAGRYAKECNENEQSLSITYLVRRRSDRDSGPRGKNTSDELKKSKDVVDRLKEAKDAVDKAIKYAKEGLTAEERKLGDTLKEYSDSVKKAYENVAKAKENLLSMTGSISQKQFNDVNKLIASYNGYNDSLGQYRKLPGGSKLPSLPSIARVKPGDLKANVLPEQTPIVKLPRVDPGPYKFMDGYNDPLKNQKSGIVPDKVPNVVGTWVTKDFLKPGSTPTGVGTSFTFLKDGTTTAKNTKWVQNGNKITLIFLPTGGRWTFTIKSDRLTLEPYREGYVPYDLFKKE